MAPDIAGHFAAAGRVADMDRVPEIEKIGELRQIVGVGVHVIAVPGLVRTAMATTVMGSHPVAVRCEEQHLAVPCVRTERPTVAEDDRLPGTPILEVNL